MVTIKISGDGSRARRPSHYWNTRWVTRYIAERKDDGMRSACAGSRDRAFCIYPVHHKWQPDSVVEIRGTMTFAPELLMRRPEELRAGEDER